MPDCYHATTSSPHETGNDVAECVRDIGGPGRLRKLATDGTKVYSFVYYETKELADEYLRAITDCLEAKNHEVYEAAVLEDFEELGFDVEGYAPDQPRY